MLFPSTLQPISVVILPHRRIKPGQSAGFTLVELLVATVILAFILMITFNIVDQTSRLWKSTSMKVASFQHARAAFDALTRNLSQATLNHRYEYYDANWKRTTPASLAAPAVHYGRFSELEYVSGPVASVFANPGSKVAHAIFFQAPLGKTESANLAMESPNMLNAIGYFVEFGTNSQYDRIPKFLQGKPNNDRNGFRLIEWVQPTEKLAIYDKTPSGNPQQKWFEDAIQSGSDCRIMAENVVALIILPKRDSNNLSLSASYFYDSTTATYIKDRSYLLPPLLQVTLVAIDDDSAQRLRGIHGQNQPTLIPDSAFQDIENYDKDMEALEAALSGGTGGVRLNYRIFTATIRMKEGE